MKYGLALPYGAALRTAHFAQRAEAAGWDGCFIGDSIWGVDPIVCLTAAAMQTSRIRLGIMIVPVPLRKPWKIAGETAALDNLSNGRLILGLGAGAVWMGWKGFPDEVTDTKARAEMLDETIDILTGMYLGKPFDYEGKHFRIKLTLIEEEHYPARPVQQPRIPLWVVGVWPRKHSMQRALKGDGLLPNKMNPAGQFEPLTPADVREMRDFADAHRTLDNPYDIIVEEQSLGWEAAKIQDKLGQWQEAGATWWVEGLWGASETDAPRRSNLTSPR